MFKIKNIIYSDAGKVLVGNNRIAFQLLDGNYSEQNIDLSNIIITSQLVKCGQIYFKNIHSNNYADWKAYIIKRRYSNDDQIAIILNKDLSEEDTLRYNKMQEWREWAGIAAKKIIEKF